MKKLYTVFSVIALTFLAAGCAKELQDPNAVNDNVITVDETTGESIVTVTLSVPESSDTKTTLGAKNNGFYPVYWSAEDVITLNGTAATEFTPAVGNTTATAKFKVTGLTTPYNFLYRGVAGQGNKVTFPASQSYVAGGFDPAAMPMYASVTSLTSNIAFSHVGALLKFSFTGSKKIDSVTLTAKDGSKSLSGTFTIGANGSGILNGNLTPASGGGTINYNFGGHKQLSDTPFVFYVAIPAGTYAGGIDLHIVDNNSGYMDLTVLDSDSTIAAGKVLEFNNVEYIQTKEDNLEQIWNASTFQSFVDKVANGEKTLNARLTPNADYIDLSSIAGSFASIEDYQGIFDGNGKELTGLTKPMFDNLQGVVKNLTLNSTVTVTNAESLSWGIFARKVTPSTAIDDIAGLQNCTAEGSITWTPSSALGGNSQLGGLVGNNLGGAIVGCTNNAAVTFADNSVTNGNQPSIGGVVGRTQKGGALSTQGDISNCTNNGTVICAAKFAENIYIGGVLGYQVEKAESMSGCVNHGLVKVASTASTGAALHLGGVVGLAKGTVDECTNASDGVVTSEACSVSTYLNQGGVVGRLNHDSGLVYETLTNAGTVNVAALGGSSGRYIGGVTGRCNEGGVLNGVTNSGNINYTSVDENSTYIGGVVALNSKSGVSLENCSSTGGTLTYSGTTEHGPLYIGGVVGYSTQPVSSCTSAMTINVGGSFVSTSSQYFSVGGIVGKMTGNNISNCLNTGNITYSQQISGEDKKGYSFVGGVVGHIKGSISDSSNGGTVTITGKNSAYNPFYGGVVGSTDSAVEHSITGKYSSASATNYGAVVINTSVQSNKYVYIGGVAGRLHTNGTMTATNNGPVTITSLTCTHAYIGGLTGLTNAASSMVNSGSANLSGGTITVTSLTANGASSYCAFIGGVVGQAKAAVTATNAANISVNGITAKDRMSVGGVVGNNATSDAFVTGTNNGDIVISSGSTSNNNIFLGGVVGHGQGNISNCTNNGLVSNAAPITGDGKYTQVGGIVGYNNGSSAISSCTNNGDVTNSGSCEGYIYVGGITSETDAAITSCHNTGDVSNSGEALVQKTSEKVYQINVGGVAGHNGGATITSCYNTGEVSNSADSGAGIMVGGVTGEAVGGTYVTCYNTGAISNTGFAYDSAERGDSALGGLVGFLNGDVTMTGTSSDYNYNNGTLSETSTTAFVALGGIAGIVKGNCELSFVKNLADGDITCANNTRKKIYIGGCVGVVQRVFSMDDASNAGSITLRSITINNNKSHNAIIGGVIGAFSDAAEDKVDPSDDGSDTIQDAEFTFYRLTNSGAISVPNSGSNGGNMAAGGKSATAYNYIGGISGVGDTYSKNFYNCTNSGNIAVYNQVKMRIGGILGYSNHNPTGCVNTGAINYCRYNPQSNGGNGEVGGVVGYMNIATPTDLTSDATIRTTGSSPNCYTGGIIGRTNSSTIGFLRCYVGTTTKGNNADYDNTISGAGEGSFSSTASGLFSSDGNSSHAWDFTGCKIKNGTKCQGVEITSSLADFNKALVGRNNPSSVTNAPTFVDSF